MIALQDMMAEPDITPDRLRELAGKVGEVTAATGQMLNVIEAIGHALRVPYNPDFARGLRDGWEGCQEHHSALICAAREIDKLNECLAGMHRMHEQHPAIVEWSARR